MNRTSLGLALVVALGAAVLYFATDRTEERDSVARPRLGGGASASDPNSALPAAELDAASPERAPVANAIDAAPSEWDDAYELVVRTVDERGAPLGGVPLQVRSRRAGASWWNVELEIRTDAATGEARIGLDRFTAADDVEAWSVAVNALTRDREAERSASFDLASPPTEPIVFELERGGSVVVEVLGPDGMPWRRGGTVRLRVAERGAGRTVAMAARSRGGVISLPSSAAGTRFVQVPLGVELEASFARRALSVPTTAVAPGPTGHGEESRFLLIVGSDHPVVRVRLVGDDGEPLVNASIEVAIDAGGDVANIPDRTDGEGFVPIELEPNWETGRARITRTEVGPGGGGHVGASGVLELDRPYPIGWTDVGELVLEGEGVLVTGRVVDPSGAPVSDAVVALDPSRGRSSRRFDVADDGTFELRGPPSGERRRLSVTHATLVAQPIEFEEGARDLVVTMQGSGTIAGSLVLDPSVSPGELTVVLTPAAVLPGRTHRGGFARIEPDGTFRSSSLTAGLYSVSVKLRSGGSVFEIEDIAVTAGRDVRDPRLDPLDLRGVLRGITLTFEGADVRTRLQGSVEYREAGTEPSFHTLKAMPRWGDLKLLSTFPALDIDIEVAGYRSFALRGVTGDQTVELRPSVPVRIVLVGDGDPFAEPYGLSAALAEAGNSSPPVDISTPVFDEQREIVVMPPGTGDMRVVWVVMRSSTTSASMAWFEPQPEQLVRVEDGMGEQRVEVRLSKAEAERLLREFQEAFAD